MNLYLESVFLLNLFQPHVKITITRQTNFFTFFLFLNPNTCRHGDEEGVHWVAVVDDVAQGGEEMHRHRGVSLEQGQLENFKSDQVRPLLRF